MIICDKSRQYLGPGLGSADLCLRSVGSWAGGWLAWVGPAAMTDSQIHRDRKQDAGCRGLQEGYGGPFVVNGDRASVWEDGTVLEMDGGDACSTV